MATHRLESVGRIDHTDLTATLQINFSTLAIRLPSTNVSFDDKAKVPFAIRLPSTNVSFDDKAKVPVALTIG
jgi:hypothetical protein